jgi:hypothetical protein
MRLSEWRAASPAKGAADPKVNAVVDPVLRSLGAEGDAEAWVVWGEEPATRYTIFAVTPAGLIACYVRVSVPGEGPRASAKLIRWGRVQVGELAVETQGAHRLLSFQVEGQVLQGADDQADRISRFAILLFASIDGRLAPPPLRAVKPARARAASGGDRKPATQGRTRRAAAVS